MSRAGAAGTGRLEWAGRGAAQWDEEQLRAELRRHLRQRLPAYMTPSAIVLLPRLPLTRHGKVDRQALPAPEAAAGGSGRGEQPAARSPVEELVGGIYAEVLGLDEVGVGENFFELGGHSLLAVQFISRLRDAFRTELTLRSLFESPTVAHLAAKLRETKLESDKETDRLKDVLSMVEQLSAGEVRELLRKA